MRQSKFKTAPPLSADFNSLKDFSSVIQTNMTQLFNLAHDHPFFTVAPTNNQGADGDIMLVTLSGTSYLYVKFPSIGWKRAVFS